MRSDIERVIFLLNPWLANPACWDDEIKRLLPKNFIDRDFLKMATEKWEERTKVHLVVGPRQVGKSTSVWKYLSSANGRLLFLNCEEALIKDWCISPTTFIDDIRGLLDRIDLLFFEEAQHLNEAGLFFKGLADQKLNKPIIVTGSSSYHLHAKTRESLAGRATRTKVTPFTLSELAPRGIDSEMIWKKLASDIISEQIRFGSYPSVWLSKNKQDDLFDLIEAFVIRDASDLFRIRHIGAFRQLLKLLSWQIGNLVNYSEWGGIAGIDYNTVKNYVDILQESGIVEIVEPFVGGRRAEITSSPVIYFNDIGLRNAFARQFSPLDERADRGKVFENWVFSELHKMLPSDVSLRFWRSKSGSEADFVLVRGKDIVGIEVKCAALLRDKISRSSRSFIEAYSPQKFFIVNRGCEGVSHVEKTEVLHICPESITRIVEHFKD